MKSEPSYRKWETFLRQGPFSITSYQSKPNLKKNIYISQILHQTYSSHRYQNHCKLIFEEHDRSLQRLRNKGVPKAPKTIEDIRNAFKHPQIYDFYCKTDHTDNREIFFDHLHESKDFAYCIFSSKKIINLIQSKTQIKERHY